MTIDLMQMNSYSIAAAILHRNETTALDSYGSQVIVAPHYSTSHRLEMPRLPSPRWDKATIDDLGHTAGSHSCH